MSKPFDHKAAQRAQMQRRRGQGVKYRDLAKEFGVGLGSSHRILNAKTDTDQAATQRGMVTRISKEKAF